MVRQEPAKLLSPVRIWVSPFLVRRLPMNEILVLYILKRHDLTIYSLQKAIEEIFFPYYKPSVGSLSPILDKMQEKGFLACDEKLSKGGMLSKKFSITQEGLKYFRESITNYKFTGLANVIREVSTFMIMTEAFTGEDKKELQLKLKDNLLVLRNRLDETLNNPYLALANSQLSVLSSTKTHVQDLILQLDEVK